MGYDLEVDMIRLAHEMEPADHALRASTADEAAAMAEAGADILIPHMGLTTKGTIGAQTALTLDECRRARAGDARRGRRRVNPTSRALPRRADRRAGGRAVHPRAHQGVVGFFGASSIERLPTEIAITESVRRFKALADA